jgi:hypothetical protein
LSEAGAVFAHVENEGTSTLAIGHLSERALRQKAIRELPLAKLADKHEAYDLVHSALKELPFNEYDGLGFVLHKANISCSFPDRWTHPPAEYRRRSEHLRWQILGNVWRGNTLKDIQDTLDKWDVRHEPWKEMPEDFVGVVQFSMEHLTREQMVEVWKEIGLRPRGGESLKAMVNRLASMFDAIKRGRKVA